MVSTGRHFPHAIYHNPPFSVAETASLAGAPKSPESKSTSALLEAKLNFPIIDKVLTIRLKRAQVTEHVIELSSDEFGDAFDEESDDESGDEAEKTPNAPNLGCFVLSSDEE